MKLFHCAQLKHVRVRVFAGLTFFILLIAGCDSPIWVEGGTRVSNRGEDYSVHAPAGWMHFNRGSGITLTRDGLNMQTIRILDLSIEEASKEAGDELSEETLLVDLVDLVRESLTANSGLDQLEFDELALRKVGSFDAAHLAYRYRSSSGLRIGVSYYAFIHGDRYYRATFSAPERYYYERDLPAFEQVLASLELGN